MKRNKDSNRSKDWVMRNSLDNEPVKDYVLTMCQDFGIKYYEVKPYKNNIKALYVYKNQNTYIAYIDFEMIEIKLHKTGANFDSPYEKRFFGSLAWRLLLNYLSNDYCKEYKKKYEEKNNGKGSNKRRGDITNTI